MQQNLVRSYKRLTPVPQEQNSKKVVIVFSDSKATKKGAKGAFEFREEKRKGQFYDLELRGNRGTVRLSEDEIRALDIPLSPHIIDAETGEPVSLDGDI